MYAYVCKHIIRFGFIVSITTRIMYISYGADEEAIVSVIFKIQELEDIYKQAKNDAMKLRRTIEGKNAIIFNDGGMFNQSRNRVNVIDNAKYGMIERVSDREKVTEPQQKRGRGRPRKIKDSLELIRGDIDVQDVQDVQNHVQNHGKVRAELDRRSVDVDEFTNAIYSIEDGELYVKTANGKLYDINTMQLKGWFNPYLKTNVWIN